MWLVCVPGGRGCNSQLRSGVEGADETLQPQDLLVHLGRQAHVGRDEASKLSPADVERPGHLINRSPGQQLHLATVAMIAPDLPSSRRLYIETLGLPLQGEDDGYHHSEQIAGSRSFGIWPLSQAAMAYFGTDEWPSLRPVPQISIEFDVADAATVAPAAEQLEQAGYELLHGPREEPWGQTVARIQSPEGAIVGISYAPMLHD